MDIRAQKLLKGLHVTFVSCSLGGLLSIVVLLITKRHFDADENIFSVDLSILEIFTYIVSYPFFGILFTGFLFSLSTNWGFFKYYWVAAKWAGVLLLLALTWFWLGPSVGGMVALADAGFDLGTARSEYSVYVRKSLRLALTEGFIFMVILFLSVLKPWGMRKKQFKINRKVLTALALAFMAAVCAFIVFNFLTLRHYRQMEITDSNISSLPDGTYRGEAMVGGFTYEVDVIVAGRLIADIKVITNRKASYARFAEGVIPRILRAQNANVDAITGATTTSKALMKAVESALAKGGNNG